MREDWVEVELGNVCGVNMGQSPPSSTYNTSKNGIPFFQGKAEFTTLHPVVQKWCSEPKKIAEVNDILLSVRAPVGATNVANQKCAIGRGLATITYTPYKYILYYLKFIERKLDSQGTGTTFKAISGKVLKSQIVPIPPLPEQRAIVAKIEQLFSELDNGIANLKTAKDKLAIYRQAVLKKAFEGELTKEWRVGNIDPHPVETQNFASLQQNNLPNGWTWLILNDLCEHIIDGDHQAPPKAKNGISFITISNIDKSSNKINLKNTFFVKEDYYSKLKHTRKPQVGDILYTVTGSFGIPVLVNEKKQFCFQRHIGLLRPSNSTDQKWLYYLLQSPKVFVQAKEKATGTAQKTVGLKTLRNFTIPFCSLPEQTQIVKEIETRLSVCDNAIKNIDEALKKSEALRQSILKKAFEGKLLSDAELQACRKEADWEPAEKLLERIRKEKK